jgi:iron(III) transport system substrate-binding protein
MKMKRRTFLKYAGATALGLAGIAWLGGQRDIKINQLTVYSGRGEDLIQPIIDKFQIETGIPVSTRYGGTSELAATILEEGANSPADLFFAQDAGALGALAKENRLTKINTSLLAKVDSRFRSPSDEWIGITGRARTVDYNIKNVDAADLPESIWGFTDPRWKGKIGWAPTNGSFQSFVTAFRELEGDEKTREWLEGILANEPGVYPKNTPIVAALGRGEIDVGFVNNYYLHRFQAEDPGFPVAHHYTKGDAGSMVNIAGLGILDTAKDQSLAEKFIGYMLGEDAQTYFTTTTYEYPLLEGMKVLGPQKPLSEIETPDLDLSDLDDLNGTLNLLQEVGVL